MIVQLRRQGGLTLVELMIATALSLVLLGGVLLVFAANKSTYQLQNGMGTLQENGRYAVRQISNDLQLAGYGGCITPKFEWNIKSIVSSPPAFLDATSGFPAGRFFAGVNDDASSTAFGTVNPVTMAPGTDSIEIRGPLFSAASYVDGETLAVGNMTIRGDDSGFDTGDILMISDCGGADIFRATSVTAAGGNTVVQHGSAQNTQGNLSRWYGADSVVTELVPHTYFVADTGRNNPEGQDIFALYRFDGTTTTPQELVDGVENLQIDYALDTNDDNTIDAFVNSGGVTNWNEVMAVRISLLLNSVNRASSVQPPDPAFNGGTQALATGDLRLWQEFTAIVAIRNALL